MSQEALVLREVSSEVWLDFASGTRPAGAPAFNQDPSLQVVGHWQRSRDLGASLEGPSNEDMLLRGEALKDHLARTELVDHLAGTDFDRAAMDASLRAYVLLLADPSGVVVRASDGGAFSEEARRLRLIAGASWSEQNRGTNAIGTAIAEQRPVYVRGNAHFARRFHGIVCYAAPIFDADGSMVAVLDATSSFQSADDAVGDAIIRTAGAITQALRYRAFGRAGAAVTRALAHALDRMEGIVLLVEPPARVTRMNVGAKLVLGDRTGQRVEHVLGLDMEALVTEARAGRGLHIDTALGSHVVHVDPIESADGKVIALLVFVEPRTPVNTRPARNDVTPAPARTATFSKLFSKDPQLTRALEWANRVADSMVPVLLLAETGSGKEIVARSIHGASSRAAQPFVAVNCASITPAQLENELFGYGPGAFAGAERDGREGLFAAASSGTIFLDEVEEMTLAMQASLLRVLEDGTYRRVGETRSLSADVRVVSATCKDLSAMVEAGTFRRDLYFRLKGAEVTLPPLRQRTDKAELAAHLVKELARSRGVSAPTLSPEVIALFESHGWPGNVRELRSLLEVSLLLVGQDGVLLPEHLPPDFRRAAEAAVPGAEASAPASDLDVAERTTIRRVLTEMNGNVSGAAKRLGVARSTLYRMMRKHGIEP